MSQTKRYYWIKLKEEFLTSEAIEYLMGQKNGSEFVVLYIFLIMRTKNTNGKLVNLLGTSQEIIVPFDIEQIARDCKFFSVNTVRVALELYRKLGLIYESEDDGILRISGFDSFIGSETDAAARMRRVREERNNVPHIVMNKVRTGSEQCSEHPANNVRTMLQSKGEQTANNVRTKCAQCDVRDQRLDNSVCVKTRARTREDKNPSPEDIAYWKAAYPDVDVEREVTKVMQRADTITDPVSYIDTVLEVKQTAAVTGEKKSKRTSSGKAKPGSFKSRDRDFEKFDSELIKRSLNE